MIVPVSGACFPCGEIPKYRKKAIKKTPKKADHEHKYEPVILSYINPNSRLTVDHGFVDGPDYAAGSRCSVCGKLKHGFPDSNHPRVTTVIRLWRGSTIEHKVIAPAYRHLPVVRLKDFWTLEEEKEEN